MLANKSVAQYTEYTWKDYGVKFSIPTTHEVKQSTGEIFESGDTMTWLEMYPYKDSQATAEGMISAVVGGEAGVSIIDEGTYKVGGYDAYYITCEQSAHPEWRYWYIGFIDPISDVNFYAKIWFKKNAPTATKIAQDMSSRFKKI